MDNLARLKLRHGDVACARCGATAAEIHMGVPRCAACARAWKKARTERLGTYRGAWRL